MATLKNNGEAVLRCTNGLTGRLDWRIMSNGTILSKRHSGGGFRKVGKIKRDLTFRDVAAHLAKCGWEVEELSAAWLDLKPAPVQRIMRKAPPTAREVQWVDRISPGLHRARVNQGK